MFACAFVRVCFVRIVIRYDGGVVCLVFLCVGFGTMCRGVMYVGLRTLSVMI